VHDATVALVRRDAALAAEVVARDAALDQLEREIEASASASWPRASRWRATCASSSPP
jgi:phosphate uptake regulator